MKKTLLSAAIAAVSLAGFSQGAFALAPSVTPDIEIFMSGATAQDKALKNIFTTNLCNPATLHIYKSTNLTDHQAFFCTIPANAVAGITVDKNVLFHKRSSGGSAQGVNPLIDGTAIAHMEVSTTSCVTAGKAGTDADPYICSTLVNKLSDAGISDVEPTLFTGPNKPSNALEVSATAANAALEVVPAAVLLFGVPVSDNLYVALQRAQNLLTGFGGSCAAGQYTDACMPSLSKQQVAELISGQIKKWSEFKVGSGAGTTLTTLTAGLTYTDSDGTVRNVTPTDTKVHYCKRIDGSGTGAQQYAKFLNNPCSTAGLNPDWAGSALSGPVKHEVSGSGDMEKCLEDFADNEQNAKQFTAFTGGADTFKTYVNSTVEVIDPNTPLAANARTAWAIGMQSMEYNNTHTKHYRFIKVDGVAPTLENAFRGKYLDWVEQTYQWRKGAAAANALNPVTAEEVLILTKIANEAGNPTIIGTDLNSLSNYDFGQSGYMAIGKNFAYSNNLVSTAPVMPYSHAVKSSLNNCQVPVIPSSSSTSKPM